MGRSRHIHIRSTALVVGADRVERAWAATLLEESDLLVIECASAEAALLVAETKFDQLAVVFTEVDLAGELDGIELACMLASRCPRTAVIVTSGKNTHAPPELPDDVYFMAKPWLPLEVLKVAERTRLREFSSAIAAGS